jgi:mRNA-degrading endonuclease toxin of MazEF toxin-antitoxin module
MTPARGEVWLFDLGMEGKVRPALIVSVAYGDLDRALVTILPHTTSLRGSQYEIAVDVPFPKAGSIPCAECRDVSEREGHPQTRCAQERPV